MGGSGKWIFSRLLLLFHAHHCRWAARVLAFSFRLARPPFLTEQSRFSLRSPRPTPLSRARLFPLRLCFHFNQPGDLFEPLPFSPGARGKAPPISASGRLS